MGSESDSSTSSDDSAPENPDPNPNPNSTLIDQTLDAIEGQLTSIVLTQTNAIEDSSSEQEVFKDAPNGSLLDENNQPEIGGGEIVDKVEVVGEVEVVSSSIGVVWRRNNSELEVDQPSSPSSSGYAGGRGSSGATSASEIEEVSGDRIREIGREDSFDGMSESQAAWIPGKRHADEDDASVSWRKRKKHFFILSHSGKPIYSRYGDEHKLAGFSATLQAIISFVENGGDRVKLVRAGKHQVVFLVKGPIYLVCISCTEEPYESLRGQLELIYGQMILILTKSVNRCFEKNPKFDMTPLLGGTDVVFSSLIHSFSWNPSTFLHAYTCLPLAYATRQAAGAILHDVADSGHLNLSHQFACLDIIPWHFCMLMSIILISSCVDTYLMLLTTSSDAFYHLKDCRIRIEMVLLKSNVLSEVQRSMLDGGMRVEYLPVDPSARSGTSSPHLSQSRLATDSSDRLQEAFVGIGGPAGLWHFIYRSIYLDQYASSEFSSPINSLQQQKRLYRAYQKLYASMHDKGNGPHKTQFRRDENYGNEVLILINSALDYGT
ncbi:SAND family protein [Actinidia rufa]|uniref:Vacuolar fusion protein MON1 homolog n=1 Tax=Actinidia rufa TaxID=165716 RepID=A0A7J0HBN5_9ERIC|nr:SAND family protein [Actinidia rufa]